MRLVIFFGIVFLISILFYLYVLPAIDKNNCVESDGVWHDGYCLKETTPDKTLEKLGLLKEEKGENYQIVIQYPFEIARYEKIHTHIEKRFERAAGEFKNRMKDVNSSGFMFLKGLCEPPKEVLSYISVECRLENRLGRRHPQYSFITANFNKNSLDKIEISNLLNGQQNALVKVSDFVRRELYSIKSNNSGVDVTGDEWIESGTYPNEGNYSSFVLSGSNDKLEAVKFMFSPYQIGMFGKDFYEIVVPVEVFEYYAEKRGAN